MKTLARSLLAALILRFAVALQDVAKRLDGPEPVRPDEGAPAPPQDPLTPEAEELIVGPATVSSLRREETPPVVLRRVTRSA